MVGKFFESRRTEDITVKVVEHNEKFNTVIIEYLTGDKKGTSSSITTSTLKRWWKEIEKYEVEVEDKTTEALELLVGGDSKEQAESIITESELTDEEYAEIGLEIAEQAKEKAEQPKKLVPMPGIEKLEKLKKEYTKTNKKEKLINYDLSSITEFDLKPIGSDNSNYKIRKDNKIIGELFIRKSFIFVCLKTVISGYEIINKPYRQFPNYHKVTSVTDITKILKEVI